MSASLSHPLFEQGERGRSSDVNDLAANVLELASHLLQHVAIDLEAAENDQGIVLWGFEVSQVDAETCSVSPGAAVFPASAGEHAGKIAVSLAAQTISAVPPTSMGGARTDVIELTYTETEGQSENREIRELVDGNPAINVQAVDKRVFVSAVAGRGEGREDALGGRVRLATLPVDETGVTGVNDVRRAFLPDYGLNGGGGWKGLQAAIDALAELVANIKPRVDNVLDANGKLKSSLEVSLGGDDITVDAATIGLGERVLTVGGEGRFQGVRPARDSVPADFEAAADLLKINGASFPRVIGRVHVVLTWDTDHYEFDSFVVRGQGFTATRSAGTYTITLDPELVKLAQTIKGSRRYGVTAVPDVNTDYVGGADLDAFAESIIPYVTTMGYDRTDDQNKFLVTCKSLVGATTIDRSFMVLAYGPFSAA